MTEVTPGVPATGPVAPPRRRRSIFARRPYFTVALAISAVFVLASIFAPFVAPYDPVAQSMDAMMQPPSGAHPMGTDSYGQDILSRVIFGARYALVIGVFSVLIGAAGGLVIGLASGLAGGWTEWVLMRGIDSILALPSLILAVAFIAILGQGVDKVVIAVGLSMIGPFARTVRADVIRVRIEGFVEAARLMSIPFLQVVWRHILPNVAFPLAVQVTIRISEAILVSSSLSFLGIGVTPPTPDWGLMIAEGRDFVSFAPWMSAMPGFALALLLIALSIVGDGIREEYDPQKPEGGVMAPEPLLDVRDLTVHRGPARILDRVTLSVGKGETLALVGESGAGKSTIATALMQLLYGAEVEGQAHLVGAGDLLAMPRREMVKLRGRRLSMIFQDAGAALNPAHTVGRHLTTTLRRTLGLSRAGAHSRAVELCTSVGINDAEARLSAFPHQLSGGMQQRVMVALALGCDPDLLLADEPTSALDVTIQAQIVRLILSLTREKGASCIFVLHDLALASQCCDRIVVLYAGQVVESGPARAVLEGHRHPYTRHLKSSVIEIGRKQVETREGTVPTYDRMPSGCRFATRCPRALGHCATALPPLSAASGDATDHLFACWNPL